MRVGPHVVSVGQWEAAQASVHFLLPGTYVGHPNVRENEEWHPLRIQEERKHGLGTPKCLSVPQNVVSPPPQEFMSETYFWGNANRFILETGEIIPQVVWTRNGGNSQYIWKRQTMVGSP